MNKKRPENYGKRLSGSVRFSPRSFLEKPRIAYSIILVLAITDAVNFINLFSLKLQDSYVAIAIITVAFLCVYDLIPLWLGAQYSKRCAGYRTNDPLMLSMCGVVLIGIILNVILRIGTKDILVPPDEIVGPDGIIQYVPDKLALIVSIAFAFVSIATSATSGYISYCVSFPLSEDIIAVETRKKQLEDEMIGIRMIIKEYEAEPPKDFVARMNYEDESQLRAKINSAKYAAFHANDWFHHLLMAHLGRPEALNFISQGDNTNLNAKIDAVITESEQQLIASDYHPLLKINNEEI